MPTFRPHFFPGIRPPFFSRPPPPPTSIPLPDEPQPTRQSSTSTAKDEKSSSRTVSALTSLNDIMPKDVEPVSPASDFDKQDEEGDDDDDENDDGNEEEDDIRLPVSITLI